MDALYVTTHRYVDLAFLVPVPPNLMNRDDLNRPKTTTFGNVTRLAPSPQSFKLSLRRASAFGKGLIRTKYLPDYIADKVFPNATDDAQKKALAKAIKALVFDNSKKEEAEAEQENKNIERIERALEALKTAKEPDRKKIDKKQAELDKARALATTVPVEKNTAGTEGLLLVTEEEVNNIAALLAKLYEGETNPSNTQIKTAIKDGFRSCRRTSASLARSLFGRMVTNAKKEEKGEEGEKGEKGILDAHRDGALQVGFPFSVERARIQTDYFIATDDLSTAYREDPGASHIGERPFAGGHTIFLQLSVDLNLLATNARFSHLEEALKTHKQDLVDIVMDVVQTSLSRPFAGAAAQGNFRTSPRACAAILRTSKDGSLCDLSPAFERAVVSEDDATVSQVASDRMLSYAKNIANVYGQSPMVTFGQREGYDHADMTSFMQEVRAQVEQVLGGAL